MGKRVNTAVWIEKYQRWQIKVQKDGARKTFYSSAPGRKGQREANEKADRWLDDGIVESSVRVSVLLDQWPVSYTHLDVYKRQAYRCIF